MDRDKGYIMLSRKFFSNRMWTASRAFSECEAWLDLIQSARFEASETVSRVGIHDVTFGRGQYPAATSFLAKRWGWSEQNVKTFLKKLKREEMITTDSSQGVNVITLCNYNEYNPVKNDDNQTANHLSNQLNELNDSELRTLLTSVLTNQLTNTPKSQPASNQNNKKDKNNIKKISTIVDTKETAACADVDSILSSSETTAKIWREDFEVYKLELKIAYESLVNDQAFIAERQKYNPKLDIRLSLEKAYNDYWNTEAGWKKKKAARSKELDWKRTFVNALSLSSNKVYQPSGNKCPYQPVTESQKKFTAYLLEHAPLMLDMPIQPNDDEIEDLRNMSATMLQSIVEEINNNRYLTNGRNSVYQTIQEIRIKRENQ